jgi:hypothetical protein
MRYKVKQERALLSVAIDDVADDTVSSPDDDYDWYDLKARCYRGASEADLRAACEAAGLTCRAPSVAPAEALQRVVDAWKPIVKAAAETPKAGLPLAIWGALHACPKELLP